MQEQQMKKDILGLAIPFVIEQQKYGEYGKQTNEYFSVGEIFLLHTNGHRILEYNSKTYSNFRNKVEALFAQ